MRGVQVANHRVRGNPKVKLSDEGLSPGSSAFQGGMVVLRAEDEVVGDGHFSDEGIVLIDGGESEAARQHWIGAGERLSHNGDPALVGCDGAAGDAEKRALAGAVLAKNRVNFAGPALEADLR